MRVQKLVTKNSSLYSLVLQGLRIKSRKASAIGMRAIRLIVAPSIMLFMVWGGMHRAGCPLHALAADSNSS